VGPLSCATGTRTLEAAGGMFPGSYYWEVFDVSDDRIHLTRATKKPGSFVRAGLVHLGTRILPPQTSGCSIWTGQNCEPITELSRHNGQASGGAHIRPFGGPVPNKAFVREGSEDAVGCLVADDGPNGLHVFTAGAHYSERRASELRLEKIQGNLLPSRDPCRGPR